MARVIPNKEFYYCRKCNFFFWRRMPEDPFDNTPTCPQCGARPSDNVTREVQGPDGNPKEETVSAIFQANNNREVQEWKRRWMIQERELPFRAAPNQKIELPATFIVKHMPKLTARQLQFIIMVLLYADRETGWAQLSIRSLCAYMAPPHRGTPLHNKTVQEVISELRHHFVYSSTQDAEVPLLHVMETTPKRYRVVLG